MPIYQSIEELIGQTPLVRLARLEEALGLPVRLLAKLERANPAGSAKDRAALYMIRAAEESGQLKAGGTIIEPTIGNTGVALASLAAVRGYKAVFTMPESMSIERRKLLAAYGAEIVLTPGSEGMAGAVRAAEALAEATPGGVVMHQFENPANAQAHFETTGPELWRDTQGCLDAFVAGVGTGGTFTGAGRYLKQQSPAVHLVAVEPAKSPLLSGGAAGPHGIQGIGANFVPALLDTGLYDEVLPIADEAAFKMARLLAKREGILTGVSSGAALAAAAELARRPEYAGKTIVALLTDTGERYLSTALFEE